MDIEVAPSRERELKRPLPIQAQPGLVAPSRERELKQFTTRLLVSMVPSLLHGSVN